MLKPIGNYIYSKPIKVYEYMAAGIPYICSNFPEWENVAERSGAGICIDPDDPKALAEAINGFLSDRQKAQAMGASGYEFVRNECSWSNETVALISLYGQIEGLR